MGIDKLGESCVKYWIVLQHLCQWRRIAKGDFRLHNVAWDANLNIRKASMDLLHFIAAFGDDVFPNLRISLQILLPDAVSLAS